MRLKQNHLAFIVGFGSFWAISCSDPAEDARSHCLAQRAVLDALFSEYGGNELLDQARSGANEAGLPGDALAAALRPDDQQAFEEVCLRLGRGGRADVRTTKAQRFFDRPDVVARCREAAGDLDAFASAAANDAQAHPGQPPMTCP